ncbi:MAG: bifunctional nuclease family protein [Candidatus Dormibacteraeota bacterium]|nr:bifunctional nuclease family protein [Candidatus Dormibacteraeota bacterium]
MAKKGFTEMQVDSIRVHMPSGQHVVILKDKGADRYLPIWIGIYEANAIALKITGITPERPITHDLMTNIFKDLGASVTRVEVNSLSSDVFYARIHIAVDGRSVDIDARPSDAIALAVRAEVPILVSDDVLDKAGVTPESESDSSDETSAEASIFKELVNSMELPDLDNPEERPFGGDPTKG